MIGNLPQRCGGFIAIRDQVGLIAREQQRSPGAIFRANPAMIGRASIVSIRVRSPTSKKPWAPTR